MKGRIIAMLAMLATLVALFAPSAQASVEPVVATNAFFIALNAGDHEAAIATFSPDAVATLLRGVEVSDRGIRWGEQVIVAEVQGGKLHTFHEKAFRLRLGS